MFDGFVNPALVGGALLAGVPLLIHLLNRQRHRPLPWAAMRFVLAAYRRTRRRARLENLLLLLLRMGAIALLALCIARPFIGARSPLSGLTESRRDLVVAIDASASTGYRQEVETVFERMVQRARELVLSLDAARGDRVRLVLAGAHPRLLAWRSPEDALSVLGTLIEPTDEPLDLVALAGELASYAEEEAAGGDESALEVVFLSDLQRGDFLPRTDTAPPPSTGSTSSPEDPDEEQAGPGEPFLAEQLERLDALGVRVLVEDLGATLDTPANLGVVTVEPAGPLPGPGTPAEVRVVVANHGATAAVGVRVVIETDGERRPSRLVDVPARGTAETVFPLVFRSGGAHSVVARIEADRLPIDDERATVITVPPPVRVLLVNGEPALSIEDDELGYLAAVLEPPLGDDLSAAGFTPPFEARVVERGELSGGAVDLADHDVIVLANVASFSAQTVERLEQRVAAGAAVLLTVGDEVDVANWNARLFRADGTGLLPAELGPRVSVADRRSDYFRVLDFDGTHPALEFFADERWRPLLTEVPVYEFLSSRPLPGPAAAEAGDGEAEVRPAVARVLARLGDDDHSPLLIERDYDRGKVFLWLTTIDRAWTRLPESPATLIPLIHELVRYAARPEEPARNVPVGAPLQAEVDGFPRALTLVRPDGTTAALEGEAEPVGAGGSWRLPPVTATERAGLYRIDVAGAGDGLERLPFSVQFDAREGDLARLAPGELARIHPVLMAGDDSAARDRDDGQASHRGELWRLLAALVLAALICESLWAAWLGWKRRPA